MREIGDGLLSLGFAPRRRASILANTVVEWVLADLAVLARRRLERHLSDRRAGAGRVPLADSRTKVLFVEDDEQLDKVLAVRERLPLLRKIVVFDTEGLRDFTTRGLAALRELGRATARRIRASSTSASPLPARRPGDPGLHLGHDRQAQGRDAFAPGIVYTVRGYNTIIAQDENDERMCFLPLCHIAERLGGEYFAIYTGSILNFVENPETVPENVREIAPTVFTAVPRIWEKFYSSVTIALRESGRPQQAAYAWGIGVGHRVADRVLAGEPVGAALRLQFPLARQLALDNVRKLIGIHRARFLRHRRGADLARPGPLVPRARRADGRGLGHDRSCGAATCTPAAASSPGRSARPAPTTRCGSIPARRAADPRRQRLHGLPQPAREDGRDDRRRRLAAHRRRRHAWTATGISGSPIA